MTYFASPKDRQPQAGAGHLSCMMLDESNGCVAGFCVGISVYTGTAYQQPGVHEDQEGFVVLEGTGWAKVGDEEFHLEPQVCFVAPAGVPHAIRRDPDAEHVKVCWFHGAIEPAR